jgi:pimeloyl-ACP methyl ester carboxylesterase
MHRLAFEAMTAVFVHGNPETAALWTPLLAELGRSDVVRLSPPGFGAPIPAGFGATADEYLAWLAAELEGLGEPVDLVGHDWGANHVMRLACQRPDLIRSWCSDTAGAWAPDYVWHEVSQMFRTAGAGEEVIRAWLAMGGSGRTIIFQPNGMAPDVVAEMADAIDEAMGRCILGVYRSANEAAFAGWRELLPAAAARPGLVIAPIGDEFGGTEAQYRWAAEQSGAQITVLKGLGHWWMLQDPAIGAETLRRFWNSI